MLSMIVLFSPRRKSTGVETFESMLLLNEAAIAAGKNKFIKLMASQKLTNCCVAAIALVTAAYLSTPHSSTIARLAFGAFCLAIHSFYFLAKVSRFG